MRKLAIAMALASTALATPAVARDNSWYVGVEGGLMIVEDGDFDSTYMLGSITRNQAVSFDHKVGVDLDLIGGYDFGSVRAEAEAGYKRATVDTIDQGTKSGQEADGNVRVYSAMANLLLDFGDDDGMSGYIGGGIGLANVRYDLDFKGDSGRDNDRSMAFQGIAGVRYPVGTNVEVGVKYRYFVAPKLNYNLDFGSLKGSFKSHSLLASLIFNFGAPAVILPPPPPPPPPPPEAIPERG
jgi:opacity protein-like surface antigen